MKHYFLGVLTCRLHDSLRWNISCVGSGFLVGDRVWGTPVPFHDMFDIGYAFGDGIEQYACE